MDQALLQKLNMPGREARLAALKEAVAAADFPPQNPCYINNHVHTTYSFSPYSPTAAVYAARNEGLCTVGIVDHDSMGGAEEFIAAGRIAGMPVTVGVEVRVSMKGTPFEKLRTNNPDQIGVTYMVMHAVPHRQIDKVQNWLVPLREQRNLRNRRMIMEINRVTGLKLDFDRDVLPLSMAHDGGGVTERHLMQAVVRAQHPGMDMLAEYDEIGRLKKELIPQVYVDADAECPAFADFIAFGHQIGAIPAYAYLGDVTQSVTGDKKAQKFEDDNLDLLFEMIASHGIKAVTYMPTRNTDAQLTRLRALCEQYGMMQISGEDINTPRQRFVIEKMKEERFSNLIESTWNLIKHENGGIIP